MDKKEGEGRLIPLVLKISNNIKMWFQEEEPFGRGSGKVRCVLRRWEPGSPDQVMVIIVEAGPSPADMGWGSMVGEDVVQLFVGSLWRRTADLEREGELSVIEEDHVVLGGAGR